MLYCMFYFTCDRSFTTTTTSGAATVGVVGVRTSQNFKLGCPTPQKVKGEHHTY